MPDKQNFDELINMIAREVENKVSEYWSKKDPAELPEDPYVKGPWIGEAMDAFAEEIATWVERAVERTLREVGYKIV